METISISLDDLKIIPRPINMLAIGIINSNRLKLAKTL
jgi:hypothetical protein